MFDQSIIPGGAEYDTRVKAIALVGLLIAKGIITEEEFTEAAEATWQLMQETDPVLKAFNELKDTFSRAGVNFEGPTTP